METLSTVRFSCSKTCRICFFLPSKHDEQSSILRDYHENISGGYIGFSDVVWTVKEYVRDSHLTLTYDSHDGEQGKAIMYNSTLTLSFHKILRKKQKRLS